MRRLDKKHIQVSAPAGNEPIKCALQREGECKVKE